MIVARCRWRLRTLSEWPSVRHKIIASTKASSIARATSGFARMSGAVFARWPAALCSFRNRDRAAVGGVRLRAKLAGTNSRPIIALLAAARSSGIKDTEPHRQGAEDRRYHSQSSPFLEIWPSAISTPLISIDGSPGSVAKTIPARIPLGATFIIRGRLSLERYISNRCRSICVDSARNSPRFVITPSICRFRIPAKYISGSVNERVALEGIPTPLGDRGPEAQDTTQPSRTVDLKQSSLKSLQTTRARERSAPHQNTYPTLRPAGGVISSRISV